MKGHRFRHPSRRLAIGSATVVGGLLLATAIAIGQPGPVAERSLYAVDSSGSGPPPPPPAAAPAPYLTQLSGPSKVSVGSQPTFTFASNVSGTYSCQIDGRPPVPCTSPFKAPKLKPGKHRLTVRVTNPNGTTSLPFVWVFKVRKPKPKA